ncbi:sperm flagellar [Chlorella sorokiniana]|jgi:hypothetical protein|uniref:Sperm flagellar n=1 Tax=Chlorella sorokiniana TaxID=3076 RepID=A0A2P6U3I3_CHLSO|nr:sperm flagellar [Chlorella sorokiniana]|eukprot:PRW60873.1 sperm flagellar [Chlorella sorokiniana]
MALPECTEEELQALYEWVDSVPLSRPKKNIARDFADGVLCAEIIHHYFPKLVELHNYSPAHNSVQKMYNWGTLNQKVFRRMGFVLAREQQETVANAEAGAIERVLKLVRAKMARFQESGGRAGAAATGTTAAVASTSQPSSPARFAATSPAAVEAVADSIAAVRLAGEVPAKLLAGGGMGGAPAGFPMLDQALAASLTDKEQQLEELRETNQILETKVGKLEQLVRLKDAKIQALLAKLQAVQAAEQQSS